jgi:L-tartrate/succinate antiporter
MVGAFFFLHYCFASITAHTATLLPLFLPIAASMTSHSPLTWALLLAYSLGLTGILTSYASGQSPIYYSSGFITRRDFWLLGSVLGVIFFVVYLAIVVPWLAFLGV